MQISTYGIDTAVIAGSLANRLNQSLVSFFPSLISAGLSCA
jgi:hypothetical protein